jgi:hypothetical protein
VRRTSLRCFNCQCCLVERAGLGWSPGFSAYLLHYCGSCCRKDGKSVSSQAFNSKRKLSQDGNSTSPDLTLPTRMSRPSTPSHQQHVCLAHSLARPRDQGKAFRPHRYAAQGPSDRRSPPGGVLRILLVANPRPRGERKREGGSGARIGMSRERASAQHPDRASCITLLMEEFVIQAAV